MLSHFKNEHLPRKMICVNVNEYFITSNSFACEDMSSSGKVYSLGLSGKSLRECLTSFAESVPIKELFVPI